MNFSYRSWTGPWYISQSENYMYQFHLFFLLNYYLVYCWSYYISLLVCLYHTSYFSEFLEKRTGPWYISQSKKLYVSIQPFLFTELLLSILLVLLYISTGLSISHKLFFWVFGKKDRSMVYQSVKKIICINLTFSFNWNIP